MSSYSRMTIACLAFAIVGTQPAFAQGDEIVIGGELDAESSGELDIETKTSTAGNELIVEPSFSESAAPDELVIEPEDAPSTSRKDELTIEPAAKEALIHTASAPIPVPASASRTRYGLDTVRLEFGLLDGSAEPVDTTNYAHASAFLETDLAPGWELRLAARLDGYAQTGDPDFTDLELDYGESYLRYRGDGYRLTAGAQKVIWGRIDELPPSDRLGRVDVTRLILDDLDERRRATTVLRYEGFFGTSKLDAVFVPWFRGAALPDKDSIWYPIDQSKGTVLGFEPGAIPTTIIQGANIDDDAPDGDGGWGLRYSRSGSAFDYAVTLQNNRQSTPYFVYNQPSNTLEARYPRAWSAGADIGFEAGGITWRGEFAWVSDVPVTRVDFSYDTVEGLNWAAGMEFHPGDGDTRVNLQLVGINLINAPPILDREEIYSVNGAIDIPFARERWRLNTRFFVSLDENDIYINPELTFLGWQPHEAYLAVHYFHGADNTLGGFYEDYSLLTLGWRSRF